MANQINVIEHLVNRREKKGAENPIGKHKASVI